MADLSSRISKPLRVAVIGGGAAGFFAAVSASMQHPTAEVVLLEKSNKLLAKVRVSGGGRCNVTHDQRNIKRLAAHYPRGERFLRRAFKHFAVQDTIDWFAQRGVVLKTEADGRIFPVTDDSSTIVDALQGEADRSGVRIWMGSGVLSLTAQGLEAADPFLLTLTNGQVMPVDRVIVTTGGHPKAEGYAWLAALGHTIVPPVPSLFTFNMPTEEIRTLMGVVADPVRARIVGANIESRGPLLITHWGMSGPAILRLSAWGARDIHAMDYRFTVQINWLGGLSEHALHQQWTEAMDTDHRKQCGNLGPAGIPRRLWHYLLNRAGVPLDKPWGELARKDRNRLANVLTNDHYPVEGKTTFKEEFVTAGGISLEEVDPDTLCSLIVPGLYFAGEILDIDGITGGFNFQSAWTTGFLAGQLG